MKNRQIFSQRLREARTKKGWTQQALGAYIGVSRPRISQYESGEAYPKAPRMQRIAEGLGVTVTYLLGRDDPTYSVSNPSETCPDDESQEGSDTMGDIGDTGMEARPGVDWQSLAFRLLHIMEADKHNERERIVSRQMQVREVDAVQSRSLDTLIQEMQRVQARGPSDVSGEAAQRLTVELARLQAGTMALMDCLSAYGINLSEDFEARYRQHLVLTASQLGVDYHPDRAVADESPEVFRAWFDHENQTEPAKDE